MVRRRRASRAKDPDQGDFFQYLEVKQEEEAEAARKAEEVCSSTFEGKVEALHRHMDEIGTFENDRSTVDSFVRNCRKGMMDTAYRLIYQGFWFRSSIQDELTLRLADLYEAAFGEEWSPRRRDTSRTKGKYREKKRS